MEAVPAQVGGAAAAAGPHLSLKRQRRQTALRVEVERRRDDHSNGNLSCSFCGKSQKEVKKLIAGPHGLHLR